MPGLRQLSARPQLLSGGHRACAGCGFPIAVRLVLAGAVGSDGSRPVVVGAATGCLEVTTTVFPYTAWRTPFVHSAFENVAATMSGVEAAFKALRRRTGAPRGQSEPALVAFGGDGGTYDIGLQALSGMLERGHRVLYVCYDNGAYANTGIQRSSATPMWAATTTTPPGAAGWGKPQFAKDLTAIVAAHRIPYAAQAAVSHPVDLVAKVEKAVAKDGPSFINVMAPCRLSWASEPSETVELTRLAVESGYWPLYEVDQGVWRLTYAPRRRPPVAEWLRRQGRFRHLFRGDTDAARARLAGLQREVDLRWEELLSRCDVKRAQG